LTIFGYRYLKHVATGDRVSPLDPLTNELFAGAWMAALLFPPIARFAALRGRVVPRIGPLVPRSWIA
jgi:hypothetical protein